MLLNHLVPERVSTTQRLKLKHEFEQLQNIRLNNHHQAAERKERLSLYLSVTFGQLRVILIEPEKNKVVDIQKLHHTLTTSFLQTFLSLFDSGLLSETANLIAGAGDGGGDDGNDDNPNLFTFFLYPENATAPLLLNPVTPDLKIKQELLGILQKKLQYAISSGDRNLQFILRDRIMLIEAEYNDLHEMVSSSFISGSEHIDSIHSTETLSYLLEIMKYKKTYGRKAPNGQKNESPPDNKENPKDKTNEAPSQPGRKTNSDNERDREGEEDRGQDGGSDKNDAPENYIAVYCSRCGVQLTQENSNISVDVNQESMLCKECSEAEAERSSAIEIINKFLDIPLEDFLPIAQEVKLKIFMQARTSSSAGGREKLKSMITLSVMSWTKDKDRKKTEEQFLEAHSYAVTHGLGANFYQYFKTWLIMHSYKKVFETEDHTLVQDDIARLKTELYNTSLKDIQSDLLPLMMLFNINALPHLEGLAKIEYFITLLKCHIEFLGDRIDFYTPVSFTPQDNIRFLYPTIGTIKKLLSTSKMMDDTGKLLLTTLLAMLIIDSSALNKKYVSPLQDVAQFGVDSGWLPGFVDLFYDILRQYMFLESDPSEKKYNDFYRRTEQMIREDKGANKELVSIATYFQATIEEKIARSKHSNRLILSKAASRYVAIAAQWPGCWHTAFRKYKKANLPDAAANAARQLSLHWQPINEQLAEYWADIAFSLNHPTDNSSEDSNHEQSHQTLEETLAYIGEPEKPDDTSKARKRKRAKAKAQETDRSASAVTPSKTGQSQTTERSDAACSTPSTLTAPVIKASPKQENKADFTIHEQQDWSINARGKTIPANEKLRYDNWNQRVKNALKDINTARKNDDLEVELKVIDEILSHSEHKIMVGIERIWEEAGWTLLHVYDDAFLTSIVSSSLAHKAREDAKMIRDKFAFPALASRLGMDQINTQTNPQELYDRAEEVLSWPEYSDQKSQDQLRHRLRCLFSTLGHTYSLEAMATPYHGRKSLGNKARTWFKFKRIDHNYVPPVRHHS